VNELLRGEIEATPREVRLIERLAATAAEDEPVRAAG
jgi:hypothetical protein